MPRYIDVEKINFKGADRYFDENNDTLVSLGEVMQIIKSTPTADVVEVRHSYWQCSNVRMASRDITCRYCHRTETISNVSEDFEYCPHCGAKMTEKDGE